MNDECRRYALHSLKPSAFRSLMMLAMFTSGVSGIDVFNKATMNNFVVHLLRGHGDYGNWHKNVNGLGMDDYAAGPGRERTGCGPHIQGHDGFQV